MLGIWALGVMLRAGVNPDPHRPTAALVQRGPFRITRNPIYLAMALLLVATGFLINGALFFVALPAFFFAIQVLAIGPEERYLERKFGGQYVRYKARVRRWF